jgi:hypothetical protein
VIERTGADAGIPKSFRSREKDASCLQCLLRTYVRQRTEQSGRKRQNAGRCSSFLSLMDT